MFFLRDLLGSLVIVVPAQKQLPVLFGKSGQRPAQQVAALLRLQELLRVALVDEKIVLVRHELQPLLAEEADRLVARDTAEPAAQMLRLQRPARLLERDEHVGGQLLDILPGGKAAELVADHGGNVAAVAADGGLQCGAVLPFESP